MNWMYIDEDLGECSNKKYDVVHLRLMFISMASGRVTLGSAYSHFIPKISET